MTTGYIYFLANRAMPNLLKVGHTVTEVADRVRQLNSTGVPAPFELVVCFRVNEPSLVESQIHDVLGGRRFTQNREFFHGPLQSLVQTALPIILRAIVEDGSNQGEIARGQPLDDKAVALLQLLTGSMKNYGYSASKFTWEMKESELEIESRFAKLKKLGLVTERRSRDEFEGVLWRITTEGVAFLFDHDLVKE